jgi:hypothetical protein
MSINPDWINPSNTALTGARANLLELAKTTIARAPVE